MVSLAASSVDVLHALLGVVAPVEAHELALAVDLGHEVDRPLPDAVHVGQRVAAVVELEVDALVPVVHEELAAILEVPVDDVDERLPVVGEPEEQLVLHLLELAALDLPISRALVEAERVELLLGAEL